MYSMFRDKHKYCVSRRQSITEISLRYYEPNHGQSEGDSCHRAITYAVSKQGSYFNQDCLLKSQIKDAGFSFEPLKTSLRTEKIFLS